MASWALVNIGTFNGWFPGVQLFLNSLRPSDAYMRHNITIIGSDNGLSPGRRQAIIWTNAVILSIGPLGTNFSEILIKIITFSFKKMRSKVSSGKRRSSCLGLNVLNQFWLVVNGAHSNIIQKFILNSNYFIRGKSSAERRLFCPGSNPTHTCFISHDALFRTEMCTFLFWTMHRGMWGMCIVGFVNFDYPPPHGPGSAGRGDMYGHAY